MSGRDYMVEIGKCKDCKWWDSKEWECLNKLVLSEGEYGYIDVDKQCEGFKEIETTDK
jgi:hypothetical protein